VAQKILGLDIGTRILRGALIEGTAREFAVRATAEVPIEPRVATEGEEAPDPRELWREAFASALAALRARLGAQPDAVITALPPAQVSSTFLELPFGETKKIEATLGFEVENILPLDLEEVVYDYQVLARTKGKSELLVGITRGEDLEALLSALAEASLDPRVVTLPALGTFLLGAEACASQLSSAENGLVFVDLGAERTLVAIARGTADKRGRPALAFLRSLETGIGEVAELANPSLEDGSDQAREIQRRLAAAIRPLRQTISAARTRDTRALDGVRLVGEACRIAGIGPWLERQLGLPVEVVDALPGGDGADPAFAQAVGLAVRGLERGRNLLNFRKGPYAFHGDLSYLKGKLLRVGAAAAVIVLLLAAHAFSRLAALDKREAELDEALCSVTLRVLGACESDFNIALSKLRGGDTRVAQIPTVSALDVMSAAIEKIPTDVGLRVTEIESTMDRMRVSGVVDSFEGVERVESALREHECIGEVRQGRVQKNRDDKVELTLDATYVCGQREETRG